MAPPIASIAKAAPPTAMPAIAPVVREPPVDDGVSVAPPPEPVSVSEPGSVTQEETGLELLSMATNSSDVVGFACQRVNSPESSFAYKYALVKKYLPSIGSAPPVVSCKESIRMTGRDPFVAMEPSLMIFLSGTISCRLGMVISKF